MPALYVVKIICDLLQKSSRYVLATRVAQFCKVSQLCCKFVPIYQVFFAEAVYEA